jgi:hypothetical protein
MVGVVMMYKTTIACIVFELWNTCPAEIELLSGDYTEASLKEVTHHLTKQSFTASWLVLL